MNQIPKINQAIIIHPEASLRQSTPKFMIKQMPFQFTEQDTIIKVLYFSIDPVMRVWYSGAKTSFSQCYPGKIFNCFAIGQVIHVGINKFGWEIGTYVFGNTGTVSYLVMKEQKIRQIFAVPTQLVNKFGQAEFLYLINNGLAAYSGVKHILNNCMDNSFKRFIVSTGSGATGLLAACLLNKLMPQAQIISLTSELKITALKKTLPFVKVLDYQKQQFVEFIKNNKFHGYFDNVGEKQLDLILKYIENKGAISLCGAISNYNSYNDSDRGLRNFELICIKQLNLKGINFTEIFSEMQQAFNAFDGIPLIINRVQMQQFEQIFTQMLRSGGGKIGKYIVKA